jgi:hypothetical protein
MAQQGGASWFCCGSNSWGPCGTAGKGACGDCDNPDFQAAWQKLNGYPYSYCGQLAGVSCGDVLSVIAPCYATGVAPAIASHGPGSGSCTAATDCDPVTRRIIDLTPAAFAQLANLSKGVITAFVYF